VRQQSLLLLLLLPPLLQADESRTGQFLSAAAKGQVDRVKLLLQQGYNANTADYDKRTALMLAAGNGHNVCSFL
jgi:ankyrin repeat protein